MASGNGKICQHQAQKNVLIRVAGHDYYDRQCVNCGATVKNIASHGLKECPRLENEREILRLTMKLYNAPRDLDMDSKSLLMEEALVKKSSGVCSFLLIIWSWDH